MFIDSHAHLEMEQFDADREQMIARARESGIEKIVAIGSGTGPGSLDCGIQLAGRHEFICATIGIHPHEARLATDADFQELEQLARRPKVIAWGEIGLDYFYDHSPRELQQQVFLQADGVGARGQTANRDSLPALRQAAITLGMIACIFWNNIGKPAAWEEFCTVLPEAWPHAKRALDLGFMISFAGNITFPKAQPIRDAAKEVPLERMLIETDSPFLAPVPHRGKRNEPAFVKEVARQLGELRGLSTEEAGRPDGLQLLQLFQTGRIQSKTMKIMVSLQNRLPSKATKGHTLNIRPS